MPATTIRRAGFVLSASLSFIGDADRHSGSLSLVPGTCYVGRTKYGSGS
jgi:hypothetical protein